MFFVGFFLQLYFFTVQNGRNIYRGGGGGGATFYYYYYYYYFFFGGGVGGMQILISIETYITCDFSGGGGGSGPPIPLWIRAWVRNK